MNVILDLVRLTHGEGWHTEEAARMLARERPRRAETVDPRQWVPLVEFGQAIADPMRFVLSVPDYQRLPLLLWLCRQGAHPKTLAALAVRSFAGHRHNRVLTLAEVAEVLRYLARDYRAVLPAHVPIFRGGALEPAHCSLSWSLSREVAECFARQKDDELHERIVPVERIGLCITHEFMEEVILHPEIENGEAAQ